MLQGMIDDDSYHTVSASTMNGQLQICHDRERGMKIQ
jgi:hypothetical protein